PVHAQLSLDGIALMGNPYLGSFERDGSPHVIVATAENYSPVRLEVVYSEDQDLVLMLEPALSLDGNNQANPMTPFSDGDTASVAPRRPYSPSREMSRP